MAEDIIYCGHCGSANKKSSTICSECEKNIIMKKNPFQDFLSMHIKDELKDKAQDSVFSLIKNYIISHLYGTILSLTIVITAGTVVANSILPSHIQKVDQGANTFVEQDGNVSDEGEESAQESEATASELDEDERYDIWHIVANYDATIDQTRDSQSYWGFSYYDSISELYASNIPGFTRMGALDMATNVIPFGIDDSSDYPYCLEERKVDELSYRTGDALVTSLAKELAKDGYRVAEVDYLMTVFEGEDEQSAKINKKLMYRFVMVEHEGDWYVAEERLIERIGV